MLMFCLLHVIKVVLMQIDLGYKYVYDFQISLHCGRIAYVAISKSASTEKVSISKPSLFVLGAGLCAKRY